MSGDEVIVTLKVSELAKITRKYIEMRDALEACQARMTEMVDERLSRRVRAFHLRFGHPVANTPHIPSAAQVRFRMKLITEEYFELCEAAGMDETELGRARGHLDEAFAYIGEGPGDPRPNLPEFADALGDLEYVIEGTRAVFGIDGAPIMAAIHAANMAKDPSYVMAKDNHHRKPDPTIKPSKPAGWLPPDVRGLLLAQGWVPPPAIEE